MQPALQERSEALRATGARVEPCVADCGYGSRHQAVTPRRLPIDAFGQIDGFFNNASVRRKPAPTHEYDVAEFDCFTRVNMRGVLSSDCATCCPIMVRRGARARSSAGPRSAASAGSQEACAYNASKATRRRRIDPCGCE